MRAAAPPVESPRPPRPPAEAAGGGTACDGQRGEGGMSVRWIADDLMMCSINASLLLGDAETIGAQSAPLASIPHAAPRRSENTHQHPRRGRSRRSRRRASRAAAGSTRRRRRRRCGARCAPRRVASTAAGGVGGRRNRLRPARRGREFSAMDCRRSNDVLNTCDAEMIGTQSAMASIPHALLCALCVTISQILMSDYAKTVCETNAA